VLTFIFAILLVYWTLVIGLQYETGTDYVAYKGIFSSRERAAFYGNKIELLFYYIALFLINNKINPQFGFIIVAFVQFFCFFWFLNRIHIKHYCLFFFVYFFVSVAFYNQTNTIRQYTAVYIFLAALYFMYNRDIFHYLLCIIMAGLFHRSAFFLLPFYYLYKAFLRLKFYPVLLGIAFLISIFGIERILDRFIPYISIYAHLTGNGNVRDITLINKLTKYVFIPFYLLSIRSRKTMIDPKDIFFYNIGFLSFCIKIFSLSSPLLNRFATYFELLTIFPMYYLLTYLSTGRKKSVYKEERVLILFGFFTVTISLFCVKVIFSPTGEYLYKSIFSRYF
jgi:hypothetical protein